MKKNKSVKNFVKSLVNPILSLKNSKQIIRINSLIRLLTIGLDTIYSSNHSQLQYINKGEINLLKSLYYRTLGINKYQSFESSGEKYLISQVLPKYLDQDAIIFDVGANIGKYTTDLIRPEFPDTKIYAFEPSLSSFSELKENTEKDSKISCYQLGLSSTTTTTILYDYADSCGSAHATLYSDVLSEHFKERTTKEGGIKEETIQMVSLDDFCNSHNIEFIDFMKIDAEGHDLEVLKGGRNMLAKNRIKIIQFEFNANMIYSRVFLKDFYESLESYFIFRLDSNQLIPLFNYTPHNEIFSYQNCIAIHKDFYQQEG